MGKIIDADDAIKVIKAIPRLILDPKGEFQPVEPPTKSMIDPDDAVTAIKNIPAVRSVMNPIEYAALNYKLGHKDGYAQGKADAKQESKWIPCSERLPDNDESVLISNSHGVTKAWWNGRFWTSIAVKKYKTVIAWMPLPEPYKERREDGTD